MTSFNTALLHLLQSETDVIDQISARLLTIGPGAVASANELAYIQALTTANNQYIAADTADAAGSPGSGGPTVTVGAGQQFATLAAALTSFGATGGTILLAGGTYSESVAIDCPTTIRAMGHVVFDWAGHPITWDQAGLINRADLLLDGSTFGMDLSGAMAQDSIAAALRPYTSTTTTLRNIKIHDCNDGILTNASIKALNLFDCEFYNCSGDDQTHAIYVGVSSLLLHCERCNFHDNRDAGNYVKSRALTTQLINCTIGGPTSVYGSKLVDACEGGTVTVTGGTWQKPANANDSHVLFGYAAENINAGTGGAKISGVTIKSQCDAPLVLNFTTKATTAFTSCTFSGNKLTAAGSVGPVTGLPA